MRTQILRLFLLAFCLLLTRVLLSQPTPFSSVTVSTNDAPAAHAPDPDSGMSGHVDGLFIPLVTGAPFHGDNTGSNPVGDANKINNIYEIPNFAAGPKRSITDFILPPEPSWN